MVNLKPIALSILLWTGILSLVAAISQVILHYVYNASLSPLGALFVAIYGSIACVSAQRLLNVTWRSLSMSTLVLLGLALAATPIRTFGISSLDRQGWAFVVLGAVLILAGYLGLNWKFSKEVSRRHVQ